MKAFSIKNGKPSIFITWPTRYLIMLLLRVLLFILAQRMTVGQNSAICAGGYYRDSKGLCVMCPPGSFSPETSNHETYSCDLCLPGTYQEEPGQKECTPCPIGTYNPQYNSSSSFDCLKCPADRTTPFTAATADSDCLSVASNLTSGFIGLFLATIITVVYILRGRFHRVAFLREERCVKVVKKEANIADRALERVIVNVDQRKDFFISQWNIGVIQAVNNDNTFNIAYDDEDKPEMRVPHDSVILFELEGKIEMQRKVSSNKELQDPENPISTNELMNVESNIGQSDQVLRPQSTTLQRMLSDRSSERDSKANLKKNRKLKRELRDKTYVYLRHSVYDKSFPSKPFFAAIEGNTIVYTKSDDKEDIEKPYRSSLILLSSSRQCVVVEKSEEYYDDHAHKDLQSYELEIKDNACYIFGIELTNQNARLYKFLVYVGLVSFSLKTIAHLRILDRNIDPSASVEEINAANKKMRDSWAERIEKICACMSASRYQGDKYCVIQQGDVVMGPKRKNNVDSRWRFIYFVLSGIPIIMMYVALLFASEIGKTIFTALILWRGLALDIDFAEKIREFLEVFAITFNITFLHYIAYPFVFAADVLSRLEINLDSMDVTCKGAQAPLELILLCVILVGAVIIIESKFSILLKLHFRMVNFRFVIAGLTYKLKYDKERAAVEGIFEAIKTVRKFELDKKIILEKLRTKVEALKLYKDNNKLQEHYSECFLLVARNDADAAEGKGYEYDDRTSWMYKFLTHPWRGWKVVTREVEYDEGNLTKEKKVFFTDVADYSKIGREILREYQDECNEALRASELSEAEETESTHKSPILSFEQRDPIDDEKDPLSKVEFINTFKRVFNRELYMTSKIKYAWLFACIIGGAVATVDPLQRLLMYMMGFAPLSPFTERYGFIHDSSPVCNELYFVPNIDAVIADLTSMLLWFIFLPAVYTLSRVLVPYHYAEAACVASWNKDEDILYVSKVLYKNEGGLAIFKYDYSNPVQNTLSPGLNLVANGMENDITIVESLGVHGENMRYKLSAKPNTEGENEVVKLVKNAATFLANWKENDNKLVVVEILQGVVKPGLALQSTHDNGIRPDTVIVKKGPVDENGFDTFEISRPPEKSRTLEELTASTKVNNDNIKFDSFNTNPLVSESRDSEFNRGVSMQIMGARSGDYSRQSVIANPEYEINEHEGLTTDAQERKTHSKAHQYREIGNLVSNSNRNTKLILYGAELNKDRWKYYAVNEALIKADTNSIDARKLRRLNLWKKNDEKRSETGLGETGISVLRSNDMVVVETFESEDFTVKMVIRKNEKWIVKISYAAKGFTYFALDLYLAWFSNVFLIALNRILDQDYVGLKEEKFRKLFPPTDKDDGFFKKLFSRLCCCCVAKKTTMEVIEDDYKKLREYDISELEKIDEYVHAYRDVGKIDQTLKKHNPDDYKMKLAHRIRNTRKPYLFQAPFDQRTVRETVEWEHKKAEHADDDIPSFKAASSDAYKAIRQYLKIDITQARFSGEVNGSIVSNIEMDKKSGSLKERQFLIGKYIKVGTYIKDIKSDMKTIHGEHGNHQKSLRKVLTIELANDLSKEEIFWGNVDKENRKIAIRTFVPFRIKFLQYVCFVAAYSGIGHFFTTKGRKRWWRVFEKYILFFKVCLGIWDDKCYDAYEFDKHEFCPKTIDEEVSVDANMDPKIRFAFLISGAISTRAVLLQIAPFLTPLSVFAIAISQSPPFVYSQRARDRLPDWFVRDPIQVAMRRENTEFRRKLKEEREQKEKRRQKQLQELDSGKTGGDKVSSILGAIDDTSDFDDTKHKSPKDRGVYWSILLYALVIFVADSRAILFFYSGFLTMVAVGIIYGDAASWTLAGIVVFTPYLAVRSMEMLIYTGRYLQINDHDLQLDYMIDFYNSRLDGPLQLLLSPVALMWRLALRIYDYGGYLLCYCGRRKDVGNYIDGDAGKVEIKNDNKVPD